MAPKLQRAALQGALLLVAFAALASAGCVAAVWELTGGAETGRQLAFITQWEPPSTQHPKTPPSLPPQLTPKPNQRQHQRRRNPTEISNNAIVTSLYDLEHSEADGKSRCETIVWRAKDTGAKRIGIVITVVAQVRFPVAAFRVLAAGGRRFYGGLGALVSWADVSSGGELQRLESWEEFGAAEVVDYICSRRVISPQSSDSAARKCKPVPTTTGLRARPGLLPVPGRVRRLRADQPAVDRPLQVRPAALLQGGRGRRCAAGCAGGSACRGLAPQSIDAPPINALASMCLWIPNRWRDSRGQSLRTPLLLQPPAPQNNRTRPFITPPFTPPP